MRWSLRDILMLGNRRRMPGMNKPIKTEADYKATLARVDAIFDAKPGTSEGDELESLLTLIELYEDKAFPIDLPDLVTAIKFRMAQQG